MWFSDLVNLIKVNFNNKINNLINVERKNVNNQYNNTIIQNINISSSINAAFNQFSINSQEIGILVTEQLRQNNISDQQVLERLKDPETLYAISNANKIACLTKNEKLRETLVSLIIQKLTVTDDEE